MEFLVTGSEMKRCDNAIINTVGVPGMVLMERAALAVVEELTGADFDLTCVLVVCGSGNNGGDGFAVARLLHLEGVKAEILFAGDIEKNTKETTAQKIIAENYGVTVLTDKYEFSKYTTIVDAIFGVGLSRAAEGKFARIINGINKADAKVLSIDVPSGICADTGAVMGTAVSADTTVSFAYKKIGEILYPGAAYTGKLVLKDIGITDVGFGDDYPTVFSYTAKDLNMLPKRAERSNKGDFGKVLVVGGGVCMAGAAYLSAKAAYKTGAGLVTICTPKENRQILQTLLPEAVLCTYEEQSPDFDAIGKCAAKSGVIVIGPGMGKTSKDVLDFILSSASAPLIIDADALNMLAEHPSFLVNSCQQKIVTPHLGEMSRLTKKSVEEIADNLIKEALDFSRKYGLVCVLKDARTVAANSDGSVYINQTGCNGMATAGSGDVLTGIIAGLLAQGMDVFKGAALGVFLHGLAGEEAARKSGCMYSLMASDIIDGISVVISDMGR